MQASIAQARRVINVAEESRRATPASHILQLAAEQIRDLEEQVRDLQAQLAAAKAGKA